MWDSDGPKTVFIVKKTGSAKTTAKLKEIAQWYAAGSHSISCLTAGVMPFPRPYCDWESPYNAQRHMYTHQN